jgi:hypothetical protein
MTISINKKDGSVEEMTETEFARWACLIEAFGFIKERADQLNIKNIDVMLKPAAIEQYIKERYLSMLHDVQCESKLGTI